MSFILRIDSSMFITITVRYHGCITAYGWIIVECQPLSHLSTWAGRVQRSTCRKVNTWPSHRSNRRVVLYLHWGRHGDEVGRGQCLLMVIPRTCYTIQSIRSPQLMIRTPSLTLTLPLPQNNHPTARIGCWNESKLGHASTNLMSGPISGDYSFPETPK